MKTTTYYIRKWVSVVLGLLFSASVLAQPQIVGLDRALAAKQANAARLLAMQGVVGVGVGADNQGHGAIHILLENQPAAATIPQSLDGIPVVARVTGKIYAIGAMPPSAPAAAGKPTGLKPTSYFERPVPIGVSTGNAQPGNVCAAGTIACRVKDSADNLYSLSNNHVYALENEGNTGDQISQPGPYDTRCKVSDANVIGSLSSWIPIDFEQPNIVDAAIASTTDQLLGVATPVGGYGSPASTWVAPALGMAVQKYGRTTALTKGMVTTIAAEVGVTYSAGTALFVNQIVVTSSSRKAVIKSGDSGSLLVTDPDKAPVGLLFAGDALGQTAIANPIDAVLSAFNVSIDPGQ